jgi:hypothetical protein
MYNELDKYRALSLEFCKNYEAHSLGLHSLHQDEQECYGHVDDLSQKMERGREPVILHYNQLMKEVDDVYRGLEASKKTLTDFYDDQHLLDSSISDKCKENYDKATCPVYLTPPGDKRIETHRDLLGMWANSANKTFHLTVAVDVVKLGQVSMIQEIIMALQHYPKLIEKTIFAIDIVFIDELKIEITPDRWKGISEPMKWFAKMNSLPCAMFFLSDHDARAYALMGDLVAGNKLPVEMRGNDQQVRIQGEMLQEIVNRLFNACWFFMLYCHNTGFDPTSYIQAIIADFDLPFTYEDVLKKYNEDIKIGIHIRTIEEVKNNPQ